VSQPLVIGLSGYARAGKDTVARILVDEGWHQASFAAALKEALYRLNPSVMWPGIARTAEVRQIVDMIGWEDAKDTVPEIRGLLQRLGTEVGRDLFGQDFWVEQAFRSLPNDRPVVFSDVRFVNEADAVKAAGGQVWRVERPGCGPVNGHASESALDGYAFDWLVLNAGSLEDLRAQVLVSVPRADVPLEAVGALRGPLRVLRRPAS
jgi:hypothetical protein